MIQAADLIAKFRQALSEKWGYIWGTAGERWTALKQSELEKTTDSDRALGRAYGKKWIGKKVADCSGLFSWSFRQLGGTMYHGSNTMYLKWCADKGTLSKGKRTDGKLLRLGTAVFTWNGRTYSHVGLYVGDDTVIEAQGTRAGVTTSKVTATKWTHWGELSGVDYASALPGTWEPSLAVPALRRGSKGDDVREIQTYLDRLGYSLGPCGIDGDFGKATEAAVKEFQKDHRLQADGIAGPETRSSLTAAASTLAPKPATSLRTWSVTIHGLDYTQATALHNNYPGSEMTEGREGA